MSERAKWYLFAVVLAVMGIAWVTSYGTSTTDGWQARQEADMREYDRVTGTIKPAKRDDVEMITECQVTLNRQLKTPDLDAFSFPDRYGWTSQTIFQVHGSVTPVNGLGQRVPKRYLCKFEQGRLVNSDLY